RVPAPDRGPLALRLTLRALWPLLLPLALRARRFLTIGFLPADARAALGLDWSPARERRLRRLATAFRLLDPRPARTPPLSPVRAPRPRGGQAGPRLNRGPPQAPGTSATSRAASRAHPHATVTPAPPCP
ncbi:hypothetical protein GA0115246_102473, partial [Streptomyces sp. SolWspMP-sol7th]